MPLREFLDDRGVRWRVWATVPMHHDTVASELRTGWLTFAAGGERRRLAPIPSRWESMKEERLRLALAAATAVLHQRISTASVSDQVNEPTEDRSAADEAPRAQPPG